LTEIIDDALRIGPKVMRSISVKEHAGAIVMIVGVAPNVIAFLDDEASLAKLAGNALGQDRTREARTNNKEIKHSNNKERNNREIGD
jgi:hypothetical protein